MPLTPPSFAAQQKTPCRKTFMRGLYLHTGW